MARLTGIYETSRLAVQQMATELECNCRLAAPIAKFTGPGGVGDVRAAGSLFYDFDKGRRQSKEQLLGFGAVGALGAAGSLSDAADKIRRESREQLLGFGTMGAVRKARSPFYDFDTIQRQSREQLLGFGTMGAVRDARSPFYDFNKIQRQSREQLLGFGTMGAVRNARSPFYDFDTIQRKSREQLFGVGTHSKHDPSSIKSFREAVPTRWEGEHREEAPPEKSTSTEPSSDRPVQQQFRLTRLSSIGPEFYREYSGMLQVLESDNPVKNRYVLTSQRVLLQDMLKLIAPVPQVRVWISAQPECYITDEGEVCWRAHVAYLYSISRVSLPARHDQESLESLTKLIGFCNRLHNLKIVETVSEFELRKHVERVDAFIDWLLDVFLLQRPVGGRN